MIAALAERFLAPALGVALLAAAITLGVQRLAIAKLQVEKADLVTEFAGYRETLERQHRELLELQAAKAKLQDKKRQEAIDAEYTARLAAQADADRLRAGAGQLQRYAADLAASLSAAARDPATAPGSPAAGSPADLLAQLSGRIDEAAAGIAVYAEDASRAGKLCVTSYDALSN